MPIPAAELTHRTPRTPDSQSKDSLEGGKDNDWSESLEKPGASAFSSVFDDPLLAK